MRYVTSCLGYEMRYDTKRQTYCKRSNALYGSVLEAAACCSSGHRTGKVCRQVLCLTPTRHALVHQQQQTHCLAARLWEAPRLGTPPLSISSSSSAPISAAHTPQTRKRPRSASLGRTPPLSISSSTHTASQRVFGRHHSAPHAPQAPQHLQQQRAGRLRPSAHRAQPRRACYRPHGSSLASSGSALAHDATA